MAARRIKVVVLAGALVSTTACGGPTGPDADSIQAIIDNSTPTITVNGAPVQAGATAAVTVGTSVVYRVDFRNDSGQTFHFGLLLVRDDGREELIMCGASGSGGEGGAFGTSSNIFPNHPLFTPGRTVRVYVIGALAGNVQTGPGQCYLQVSQGVPNHANVQFQRLLVTLTVQ